MAYLDNIYSPRDIQKIGISELPVLAEEIRAALIDDSSRRGTHLGPCLGVVELTMALYYVFDMEHDQIVFDVSHQSAVHKILSGRKEYFFDPDKMGMLSEFTNPKESPYDLFRVGHTSTAISLAAGLIRARDLLKKTNQVIAVVGDGALSGGEAWEGLNYVSTVKSPCVVVLNDNEMSISNNQGGLYPHLAALRQGKSESNLFQALGFDYLYVEQGHDFPSLIEVFKKAKEINRPVVVHVHTTKGKGFAPAEKNQEQWHSMKVAFDKRTGDPLLEKKEETYLKIVPEYFIQKAKEQKEMVVMTAGTAPSVGFTQERRELLGHQFIDVGIAEGHVMTMASAMAKNGCRPVVCIYSSFLQRAFDQVMQDISLNQTPVVIVVFGGMMSGNDATHQGIFDIPMMSSIPGLTVLAPVTQEEVIGMLDWAIWQREKPVVIRLPRVVIQTGMPVVYQQSPSETIRRQGSQVAVVGVGGLYPIAEEVVDQLEKQGIKVTLIHPQAISPINVDFWNQIGQNHKIVVTIEDGSIVGGYGEKIAALYARTGIHVMIYGAAKEFIDREPISSLFEKMGLVPEKIVREIQQNLIHAG